MLVTINEVARGRRLRDIARYHDEIGILFDDGVEARVAWGWTGPEIKGKREGVFIPDSDIQIAPQFRYCMGKTVKATTTEVDDVAGGRKLHIVFTDGHELVVAFLRQPDAQKVDVRVNMPIPAAMSGLAAGF